MWFKLRKKYINLRKAARISGYSSDYIGYLIRIGKIEGKRVYLNTSWRISPKEIIKYCQKNNLDIRDHPFLTKKGLSLKEAAQILGYTSDYIGCLIRKGKMAGKKAYSGIAWMTTEKAIKKYQQKAKSQKLKVRIKKKLGLIYDIIPPEKIKEVAREIAGLKPYKTKFKKIFAISWRLTLAGIILFLLIGIGPTDIFQKLVGAFTNGEKTVNLYPVFSDGGWKNPQNVQGQPEVGPLGDFNSFSEANSAVYQGGSSNLILSKFIKTETDLAIETENQKTESAPLPEEEKPVFEEPVLEIPPIESTTPAVESVTPPEGAIEEKEQILPKEEPTSFLKRVKNFFGNLTAKAQEIPTFDQLQDFQIQSAKIKFSFAIGEKKTEFPPLLETPSPAEAPPENPPTESVSQPEEGIAPVEIPTENTTPNEEGVQPLVEPEKKEEIPIQPEEAPQESSPTSFWNKIKNFFSVLAVKAQEEISPIETVTPPQDAIENVTPPVEALPPIVTTTSPAEGVSMPNIDTKIIIWYSLDGEIWQKLDTVSTSPLSNASNHGYFSYDAPFLKNWDDVKNLKIKFEGVVGGETNFVAYLDSVWVEVNYQEIEEEKFELRAIKRDWQADEEPEFELVNINEKEKGLGGKLLGQAGSIFEKPAEPEIKAELIKPEGEALSLNKGKDFSTETHSPTKIKIFKLRQFQPGLHKLKISFEKNGKNYELEQEFTWGVLAINVNKSIYLPGDQAYIQMAALNDDGHTICDANLKLEITSPSGKIVNPEVQKSGECGPDNVTNIPDYFAYYQVGEPGVYQMILTQMDTDGNTELHRIEDSFEVRDSVPFDVERIGPTRIYPPATYEMTLKIKANQDFEGQVIEQVPASFEVISHESTQIRTQNDTKIIEWQVDWKTGESYELKYQFDAPDISPYLYLLGPLEFYSSPSTGSGRPDFKEIRSWQIASDAPSTVSTSTNYYATSYPNQRKSFYANGRFWVFYSDGTNMTCQTSTDGSTWSACTSGGVTWTRACAYGYYFAIFFDGTYFHYAYSPTTAGEAIYYRRGTPNSDGSITWSAVEQTAVAGTTGVTLYFPNIGVDSSGYPWIGYTRFDGTYYYPYVTKSSTNNGTWTTATGFPYQLSTTSAVYYVSPIPLTNQKILAVYASGNATIKARRWDGSAWGTEVATTSSMPLYAYKYSAVNEGDDVHLVHNEINNNIFYTKYQYSSNSFSAEVTVQGGTPIGVGTVLSWQSTGKLKVFWGITLTDPTQNYIYYKTITNGTPDTTATVWIDEASGLETGQDGDEATWTTNYRKLSQSFKVYATANRSKVKLYLKRCAGTADDPIDIEIHEANDDGTPKLDILYSSSIPSFTSTSYAWYTATFSNANLTAGKNYAIVISGGYDDASNYYCWGVDSTSPTFSDGNFASKLGAAAWTAESSKDALFVIFIDDYLTAVGKNLSSFYKAYNNNIGLVYVTTGYHVRFANYALIDVTGNAYEDEGTTKLTACNGTTSMIALRFSGTTYGPVVCSATDGSFTFSTLDPPAAGTPMFFWIDGATCGGNNITGSCASTLILYSASISDAKLRRNRLIVRHDDSGPVTNANLGLWDNADDPDIVYDVDASSNLTVEDNIKLIVNSGDTFTPGATVTTSPSSVPSSTDGDILIESTATLNMGTNSLSVGGDYTNSGTFTITVNQTTTFTATGTGFSITPGTGNPSGNGNLANVTFNGTGGGWSFSTAATLYGTLTMTAGTLSGTSDITVKGGDISGSAGAINLTAGTFTLDCIGTDQGCYSEGFGSIANDSDWTFYNLTIGGTSPIQTFTTAGTGKITITNVFTLNETLNAGTGKIWVLSGSGTPFVKNLTFNCETSTFNYTGLAATTVTATTYYNLGVGTTADATAVTYTLGGNTTVQSVLTVGNTSSTATDTLAGSSYTLTLSGSGTPFVLTAHGTFSAGTSTVNYTGDGATTIAATTYYNLTFSPTITVARTYTGGGAITVNNNLNINPNAASALALTFNLGGTTSVTGSATIQRTGSATATLNTTVSNYSLTVGSLSIQAGGTLTGNASALDSNGDVTIASGGTLTSTSGNFNVGGSWSNSGTFTHSSGTVIFDATTTGKTISDGGSAFYNIIFNGVGGGWTYQDGSSTAPNQTTVQNGTPTFLNAKTGTVSVTGGTLNVDWYLGVHVVDAANTATNIDTGDADITISENSATPQSTVWRHNGTDWGTAATSQTTGTDATGKNPQPNSAGAIRIREYSMTSSATCPGAGCTLYKYNLQIAWQSTYGEYNYYSDYGNKYLTSTLNTGSGHDEVISVAWYRSAPGTMNTPYSAVNDPPTNGSWYVGMLKGLEVTITGTSIDFGSLDSSNNFTATAGTQTQITVTTSATSGYIVTAWETQLMTCSDAGACGSETIQNFTGTYADPQPWTILCKDNSSYCGFGFTSSDTLVEGSNRYNSGTEYTYFPTDSSNPVRVMDYSSPVSSQSYSITYRISAPLTQRPGPYTTTIIYVVTAQY